MSTPEAAWPDGLIELRARVRFNQHAYFSAEWERVEELVREHWREEVRRDLNAIVAWRDPKGEPAVVRADDLTVTAWMQARRRAEAAEARLASLLSHESVYAEVEELRARCSALTDALAAFDARADEVRWDTAAAEFIRRARALLVSQEETR